jgi:hypothetical protein
LVGTVVRLLGSNDFEAGRLDAGPLSLGSGLRLDFADQAGYALLC